MILVFDNQGDDVILRVVVKRNTQPNLDDFWGAQIIPRFEERSLTELQKRSIYLEFENGTEESVFFYVGLLPHQVKEKIYKSIYGMVSFAQNLLV